jgi:hypothetical protein
LSKELRRFAERADLGADVPAHRRRCTPVDRDGDGAVSISELLLAVNAALGGCA